MSHNEVLNDGSPSRGLPKTAMRLLLQLTDAVAALFLAADLVTVLCSVVSRYFFNDPIEWSDDVARELMVATSFFGAAGALARGENVGVMFFVERLPGRVRGLVDATVDLLVVITAAAVAVNGINLALDSVGQTTGSGLPAEYGFYPMGIAGGVMAIFAADVFLRRRWAEIGVAVAVVAVLLGGWLLAGSIVPDDVPGSGIVMAVAFVSCLVCGMPIGFVLAQCALVFIWVEGTLPGVIFAQQMARGIDNFVLLAIPFFILIGYLMEANGMSVRLIEAIERLVGRLRGGLNVVMILSMVIFSGISGSKMADVAAVGSVLIPAARRNGHNPGNAVAVLAASAVMAETIPPCINLIILGFVANISIGGLFMAGLLPAALMAAVLVGSAVLAGTKPSLAEWQARVQLPMRQLWGGIAAAAGLLVLIFGGFRSGFATATEVSSFGALYALIVGGLVFRELTPRAVARTFVLSATRSGLVLFIIAAAQALSFVLTLQGIPHALGAMMVSLSQSHGTWLFLLASIAILIVMGSVLEGAAALIIFGPLLVPVASALGISALHFGVVLVIAMGIGLFAPPLGLGLYGTCLIGGVSIEATVKPMMKYLGLLLACLVVIAFVPAIATWLPHMMGY